MKYTLTADYHTHTIFSHGSGTIRDNVMAAREKGLKEIGITEHGPGSPGYGIHLEDVPEMKRLIEELNEEFSDISIYLGVEANIKESPNGLDITKEDLALFDYVTAGYHFGVIGAHDGANFWTFAKGIRKPSVIAANTDMALKAIYENDIKILTHPGFKAFFDMEELARACAETDTLMEINVLHNGLDIPNLEICAKSDARFVISSDAHDPADVGRLDRALERAEAAGIDLDRIVNLRKLKG